MTNKIKTLEEYALEREERDRNYYMINRHLNRKFPGIARNDDRIISYLKKILVRGDKLLRPITKKNMRDIRTNSSFRLGSWYNKPGCGYRILFPGAVSYELNPGESPSAYDIADKIRQGVDGVSPRSRNSSETTLFFSPGSIFHVSSATSNPDCTTGSFELYSNKWKANYQFERDGERICAFFEYFETDKDRWEPRDI